MSGLRDIAVLSVMSVMAVSTFFLFLMLLAGMMQGGITEQYDLNYYGEGWLEVVAIGIGLVGSPFVIHNYIYSGAKDINIASHNQYDDEVDR